MHRKQLFEWDSIKARRNVRKHGVTFNEAATCFTDDAGKFYPDKQFTDRFLLLAHSDQNRLLITVHAELDGDRIRIISARKATSYERRRYEEDT